MVIFEEDQDVEPRRHGVDERWGHADYRRWRKKSRGEAK